MKKGLLERGMLLVLSGALATGMTACSGTAASSSASAGSSAASGASSASSASGSSSASSTSVGTLNVYFVPSKDPQQIITATQPLKDLLKTELAKENYSVGTVNISVGTTYEAVGEAMSAGTADVGFIPGGTYVTYEDAADVILTATRAGLSKDSDNAKDWNDGKPTLPTTTQTTSYRALLIAGPSAKGKALGAKVNAGQKLTFDDLSAASWSIMSSSSPAGYIYPALWLQKNFGKTLTDLPHAVQSDSYGSAFARLASGQVDLVACYADARRDFEKQWTTSYGRKASIWSETNVVGVTPPIYNDTISVSKTSKIMTPEFIKALQTAFINIGNSAEGKKVIAIYSHEGYKVAQSSDYDNERAAQKLLKQLTKK